MSAPSSTSRCACASAAAGSRNRPPSENESGVTLRMPITSGRPLARRAASRLPAGAAPARERAPRVTFAVTVLAAMAFVPLRQSGGRVPLIAWLCAAIPVESSGGEPRSGLKSVGGRRHSIADQRRQFFGVLNPASDRIHRRQNADQFALGVHLRHDLPELLRIAIAEFIH